MKLSMRNGQKLLKVLVLSVCFVHFFSMDVSAEWPDFPLSSDCFSSNTYGTQSSPAIATGGDELLVVWEDQRIFLERDIFATRITQEGEITDPFGIPICTAPGQQTNVKVAAGDQNYLVVWQDRRGGASEIYGARLNFDGTVLDPDGFQISTGTGWAESPDVTWDGENFMVVFSYDRYELTSYDIYATRISTDGQILDPRGIQLSFDDVMELYPSISFCDSVYLVAWEHALG
jgi:hypothetical protein